MSTGLTNKFINLSSVLIAVGFTIPEVSPSLGGAVADRPCRLEVTYRVPDRHPWSPGPDQVRSTEEYLVGKRYMYVTQVHLP